MNDNIPQNIQLLVCRGYLHKETRTEISLEERREFEHRRRLARRWRNLIGELKYDLPRDMWKYTNMSMPKEWHMYRHSNKIKSHQFVIQLPNFLPIVMTYKRTEVGHVYESSDWQFYSFEITSPSGSPVISTKYEDLPLFLAVAHELGQKRYKNKVDIEEIQVGGDLAENAKTVKFSLPVLTMEDFVGPTKPKSYQEILDHQDRHQVDSWKKHEFYDPYAEYANLGGA